MSLSTSPDAMQLAESEQRFSRRGLLTRYARGRVQHFGSRQVVTALGGLVLALIGTPLQAMGAVALVLLGEAVDCLYLRWMAKRLQEGAPISRLATVSTITATFQAMTICYAIVLAWYGGGTHGTSLLAVAFLSGAGINAGLVTPYHRAAGQARLLVYLSILVVLLVVETAAHGPFETTLLMEVTGSSLLAYMVWMFIAYVNAGFRRNRTNTLALIDKGRQLSLANEELRKHQKEAMKLSLVARNANDSVILSDHLGRITWVNGAFERNTGYSFEDVRGKRPGDLLNAPDTCTGTVRAIGDAIKKGRPFRGEILNKTKDGRLVWTETNLVPVLDGKGRVEMTVAIERDITETKKQKAAMDEARQTAEEAARAKADFLATMSHEIRTPMNGVIGMADLLVETRLDVEQRLFADTIRSSAQSLLAIINDILDLSKLDAKRMTLSPVDFDLRSFLNETVQLMNPQAREKGLRLELQCVGNVPDHVRADDGRLRQVLLNLIGNAIKFTETGHVIVRVRAEVFGAGHRLSFEVEDTGIGISPDKLDKIFERFEQAEVATTRRFGGTGLGLTISRLLVEAMGGRIEVSSEEGNGSRFKATMFAGLVSGPAGLPDGPDTATDSSLLDALAGKCVLLAEDNRVNRLLVRKFLRDVPVRLELAKDGQQAVEKAAALSPDIILMDMSMPVMNGLEATRHIRSMPIDQPVIVALTANAFESDRNACLQAGMDGFLTKPVRRAEIVASLVHYCAPPGQVPIALTSKL